MMCRVKKREWVLGTESIINLKYQIYQKGKKLQKHLILKVNREGGILPHAESVM